MKRTRENDGDFMYRGRRGREPDESTAGIPGGGKSCEIMQRFMQGQGSCGGGECGGSEEGGGRRTCLPTEQGATRLPCVPGLVSFCALCTDCTDSPAANRDAYAVARVSCISASC